MEPKACDPVAINAIDELNDSIRRSRGIVVVCMQSNTDDPHLEAALEAVNDMLNNADKQAQTLWSAYRAATA